MKRLLVVVDMQNDFVTGALGTPEARAIVPAIAKLVKDFNGDVAFTRDTHYENYSLTQEGKKLPVIHCLENTEGWQIVPEIEIPDSAAVFNKNTFGSTDLAAYVKQMGYADVTLCGVCTGICVLSNASLIKSYCPEVSISVIADMCACVTPQTHKTALDAMKNIQIDIV